MLKLISMESDEIYLDVFRSYDEENSNNFSSKKASRKSNSYEKNEKKSPMSEDSSTDIYSDLSVDTILQDDTHTSPVKEDMSIIKLPAKLKGLEGKNLQLLRENRALQETKKQLTENISALYLTARKALKEKDEEITKLRENAEMRNKIVSATSFASKLVQTELQSCYFDCTSNHFVQTKSRSDLENKADGKSSGYFAQQQFGKNVLPGNDLVEKADMTLYNSISHSSSCSKAVASRFLQGGKHSGVTGLSDRYFLPKRKLEKDKLRFDLRCMLKRKYKAQNNNQGKPSGIFIESRHHSEIRDRLQQEISVSFSLSGCQGVASCKKYKGNLDAPNMFNSAILMPKHEFLHGESTSHSVLNESKKVVTDKQARNKSPDIYMKNFAGKSYEMPQFIDAAPGIAICELHNDKSNTVKTYNSCFVKDAETVKVSHKNTNIQLEKESNKNENRKRKIDSHGELSYKFSDHLEELTSPSHGNLSITGKSWLPTDFSGVFSNYLKGKTFSGGNLEVADPVLQSRLSVKGQARSFEMQNMEETQRDFNSFAVTAKSGKMNEMEVAHNSGKKWEAFDKIYLPERGFVDSDVSDDISELKNMRGINNEKVLYSSAHIREASLSTDAYTGVKKNKLDSLHSNSDQSDSDDKSQGLVNHTKNHKETLPASDGMQNADHRFQKMEKAMFHSSNGLHSAATATDSDKNINCNSKLSQSVELSEPIIDSVIMSIAQDNVPTDLAIAPVTHFTCTSNLIILGDEETTCTIFSSPNKSQTLPSEFYPPGVRGQVTEKSSHVRHIREEPELIKKLKIENISFFQDPISKGKNKRKTEENNNEKFTDGELGVPHSHLDSSHDYLDGQSQKKEVHVPMDEISNSNASRNLEKTTTLMDIFMKSDCKEQAMVTSQKSDISNLWEYAVKKTFKEIFSIDLNIFKMKMACRRKALIIQNQKRAKAFGDLREEGIVVKEMQHLNSRMFKGFKRLVTPNDPLCVRDCGNPCPSSISCASISFQHENHGKKNGFKDYIQTKSFTDNIKSIVQTGSIESVSVNNLIPFNDDNNQSYLMKKQSPYKQKEAGVVNLEEMQQVPEQGSSFGKHIYQDVKKLVNSSSDELVDEDKLSRLVTFQEFRKLKKAAYSSQENNSDFKCLHQESRTCNY